MGSPLDAAYAVRFVHMALNFNICSSHSGALGFQVSLHRIQQLGRRLFRQILKLFSGLLVYLGILKWREPANAPNLFIVLILLI